MNKEIVIFNKENNNQQWYTTNDDVMGGISNSTMKINKFGKAIFSGEVSLENNGGFAMTRLPVNIDLKDKKQSILLKVKGDGKSYQLRLKSKRYQKFWYIKSFQTTNGITEIKLPLSEFYPSFRGYRLNFENFSSNKIKEIAILIGNKKNEKFSLEIEQIVIR